MSQLQTQKTALETRRATLRANLAAAPNDQAAADALSQTESELATVNTQIIRGPGARHVVNAAIGRAAVAAYRKPQGAALPTPAAIPTAARAAAPVPHRYEFQSESDVTTPTRRAAKQNGPGAVAPTASAAQPATPLQPAAQPPRRFAFQSENDVPTPQAKPLPAHLIFRANGHR